MKNAPQKQMQHIQHVQQKQQHHHGPQSILPSATSTQQNHLQLNTLRLEHTQQHHLQQQHHKQSSALPPQHKTLKTGRRLGSSVANSKYMDSTTATNTKLNAKLSNLETSWWAGGGQGGEGGKGKGAEGGEEGGGGKGERGGFGVEGSVSPQIERKGAGGLGGESRNARTAAKLKHTPSVDENHELSAPYHTIIGPQSATDTTPESAVAGSGSVLRWSTYTDIASCQTDAWCAREIQPGLDHTLGERATATFSESAPENEATIGSGSSSSATPGSGSMMRWSTYTRAGQSLFGAKSTPVQKKDYC